MATIPPNKTCANIRCPQNREVGPWIAFSQGGSQVPAASKESIHELPARMPQDAVGSPWNEFAREGCLATAPENEFHGLPANPSRWRAVTDLGRRPDSVRWGDFRLGFRRSNCPLDCNWCTKIATKLACIPVVLGIPLLHFGSAIANTPTEPSLTRWPVSLTMPSLKGSDGHPEHTGGYMPVDCIGISGPGLKFN
jgi:hypothetical protein